MSLKACLLSVAVLCLPALSRAADPQLRLPAFDHLQQIATDSVNVTLGPLPLGLAALALDSKTVDDLDLQELLHDVKTINVRSFDFAADNMYSESDVTPVRQQLSAPGWNALAQIRQRRSGDQDVDVFVSMDHEKINGIAIVASAARRLTIVNIVGSIDPARLARLQGRLGLPGMRM